MTEIDENDLYSRLGRIENKLNNINDDIITAGAERHDTRDRIIALEKRILHHEASFKTTKRIVIGIWTIIGSSVTVAVGWLIKNSGSTPTGGYM